MNTHFASGRPSANAVGLGLASTYTGIDGSSVDVSIIDLIDLERFMPFRKPVKMLIDIDEAEAAGALSIVSLGVGAVTMLGSRAVGVKGFVEAVARVCEVFGSPQARKWAGPAIGVLTAGLAIYVVIDLPRAIPRNIGRKLQLSLAAPSADASSAAANSPSQSYSTIHADRISKETRKVLRLAGWDLRDRFRAALEESEQQCKEVEGARDKSMHALEWLDSFMNRVETEEVQVKSVLLEDA